VNDLPTPERPLSDLDIHLFNEGTHSRLAERFGARPVDPDDPEKGIVFSVWAPDAEKAFVIGDVMHWDTGFPLQPVGASGLWSAIVRDARPGQRYKFRVVTKSGTVNDRSDPLARVGEGSPGHASVIDTAPSHAYEWGDDDWMSRRADRQRPDQPLSIYEVHLGSWRWHAEENRPLGYREVAPLLAEYCVENGFTHVEFLPLMEHPYTPSWGYQVTGFFQPTVRFGQPDDLRFLIDHLHRAGVGVIFDWVPAHFPSDGFALAEFDGTHLYEHADPKEGRHPDWGSLIFNYGRHEVRSFLVSSACWWLESYHVDGLRVDAVASMLYRDYSRAAGEWIPNRFGGRENLEAIELLRAVNDEVHSRFPGAIVIAEESTAWGGVTGSTESGGLGFDYKWDMGWMHDTLDYLALDPVYRKWHQNDLTFRQMYATTESFVLAVSHDEVVHGKGSLINKMSGDDWQKRANLRLLFGYQHALPGKKLMFMGGEFGQRGEWSHERSLDWHLLQHAEHDGIRKWVATLNHLHASEPALHQLDHDDAGFFWISCDDSEHGVLALVRRGRDWADDLVIVCNFTPVAHEGYRIGMPHTGTWELVANSDDREFGGSGYPVPERVEADGITWHAQAQSALVNAVPLGMVVYRRSR